MKKLIFAITILLSSITTFSQKEFGDGIYAVFNTTKGEIIVQLEYEKVPMTVANFVALAEGKMKHKDVKITDPFFDGLKFHRVIKDFMIQGGDPNGNGSGDPGYKFYDEIDTTLKHTGPGILSMANSGPNTNGSQFFITHKETPWLDGKHAVFGHVVKGQDAVDKIEQGDVMESVEIVRVGKSAKKFKASKVFNKEFERIEKENAEKEAKKIEAFKSKWSEKYPDMKQTDSGLMYEYIKEGEGATPKAGDEITFEYTGYLEDGTEFETSKNRTQDLSVIYKQVQFFKGWEEAFDMMQEGDKMRIVMPPWLGLGSQGRGQIPPNAELVFELELVEVKDVTADFEKEMAEKFPNAKMHKSGVMYEILKEGDGEKPQAGQNVEVNYKGTLIDGTKFDSSYDRGQTFSFPLGKGRVIKGWDAGIPLCKVGGKIKLIIPYWMAYGERGSPPKIGPNEHLVFEVEVISVK